MVLITRILKILAVFSLFVFPLVFVALMVKNTEYLRRGDKSPRKVFVAHCREYSQQKKSLDLLMTQLRKGKTRNEEWLKAAEKKKDAVLIKEYKSAVREISNEITIKKHQLQTISKKRKTLIASLEKNKFGYLQYLMGLTALYWMSNMVPIGAVGLVPLTVAPLMRIIPAKVIIKSYMTSANMMILCGSIISLGAAAAGLSKRVSFRILSLCGNDKRRLTLCVMLISLISSMWWINTAVMVFMSTVIDEIVHELREGVSFGTLGDSRRVEWNEVTEIVNVAKARKKAAKEALRRHAYDLPTSNDHPSFEVKSSLSPGEAKDTKVIRSHVSIVSEGKVYDMTVRGSLQASALDTVKRISFGHEATKRHEEMRLEMRHILEEIRRSLHHCAAVMCSVGGLYWSYTSTTNTQVFHSQAVRGLSLADWTVWTFPILCATVPFTVFCLDLAHFGPDLISPVLQRFGLKERDEGKIDTDVSLDTAEEILLTFQDKYFELGPMTAHEKGSLVLMVVTITAVLVRMAGAPTGWLTDVVIDRPHKRKVEIEDSTVLAIAVVVGFFFPRTFKQIFQGPKTAQEKPTFPAILGWKAVQDTFPWGILIIIGGSVSLGEMYDDSGLDVVEIARFQFFYKLLGKEITLFLAILYTIIVSNSVGSTCAAIVGARIFSKIDNSCYFSLPTVAASSFAFLFPVGTSAMAVASLKMDGINGWYCIRKGLLPSILCPFIVYLFGLSYLRTIPCASKIA